MDTWIDIRRKARECHNEALITSRGNRNSSAIIEAALENDFLEVRRMDLGGGTLGSLDRSSRLVNVAVGQKPVDERVVIAHEIGHFRLHVDPHSEVTASAFGLGGDAVDSGAGKVEGYSPHERKELQADIFAGELLCPTDWLREQYVVHKKKSSAIAEELELPHQLVVNQLIRALLLPPLTAAKPKPQSVKIELDDSQRIAATWRDGALLVDAGPGTGKTRTLISRVEHLFSQGVTSGEFLALTFSNKAAEEMRERLSAMNADASIEMWVGTFHAFGLELIKKWPSMLGRTSKVRILDQAASLSLLEENLERLPLSHYQNLYDPALELVQVLKVISRCKDELITPGQLAAAAIEDERVAETEEEREKASKTLEIAAIYDIYESCLLEVDAVDFGDCVRYALTLISENPAVASYVAGFSEVMVDEYQDVNFASSEMLRAIKETGANLWVVADERQSIYRFRGAEPTNVSRFPADFSGKRVALAHNYRSLGPVVRSFERFSASMGNGSMAGQWNVHRDQIIGERQGSVSLVSAPTVAAEAEVIRDKIQHFLAQGVALSQQVILARSHLTLSRVTNELERLGVPLLYLGDLFERQDIRDLLSLLAIDAEHGAVGLPRVLALTPYLVAEDEALLFMKWAKECQLPVFDALHRASEVPGLTPRAVRGLQKLGSELAGLNNSSPWTMLTTWLLDRSSYLEPLLHEDSASARQKLVAIYQLLKVCGEFAALGETSRKRFLARVRRIESLNEDTAFRAVSSEATDMDAVRVMTIHGSKGLEFEAVHLPGLATGYMPGSWRGARYSPPSSLSRLAVDQTGHIAEEQCLFFVAISRARDFLSLSRAEKYTTVKAGESAYLRSLLVPSELYAGSGGPGVESPRLVPPPHADVYPVDDLDLYLKCNRRYRYQIVDALRGGRDASPYVSFHRCVYKTLDYIETQVRNGTSVSSEDAVAYLDVIWSAEGPIDHGFSGYYLAAAQGMVKRMAALAQIEPGQKSSVDWRIPLGSREVSVVPDRVVVSSRVVKVQRLRTGRKTKSEPEKPIYSVLRRAAELAHPGKTVEVEALYLSSGEKVPITSKADSKNLAGYSKAIDGIEAGSFGTANAKPRDCPSCPFYFRCTG